MAHGGRGNADEEERTSGNAVIPSVALDALVAALTSAITMAVAVRGDPGEALVRQVAVAEDQIRAGVLHNYWGRVHLHRHRRRDLAWTGVRRCGPGAVYDVGEAVELPWMDRAW